MYPMRSPLPFQQLPPQLGWKAACNPRRGTWVILCQLDLERRLTNLKQPLRRRPRGIVNLGRRVHHRGSSFLVRDGFGEGLRHDVRPWLARKRHRAGAHGSRPPCERMPHGSRSKPGYFLLEGVPIEGAQSGPKRSTRRVAKWSKVPKGNPLDLDSQL